MSGVVCASAGNHAQGVAFSCRELNIKGVIYMPAITPKQKINQVKMFGGENIEIVLIGDTFDECQAHALEFTEEKKMIFIPPFDHAKVIEGQGTVAKEILDEQSNIDYCICANRGWWFVCRISQPILKPIRPIPKLLVLSRKGAPSMKEALKAGKAGCIG
jgi:threonine dehydratase